MAHFAQLDENNFVTQVIVVHNNELLDNGVESEAKGVAFCQSLFGVHTRWVQTSYNNSFRFRYAGIGYTYNSSLDAFIPPKPIGNPSWIVNSETASWSPPVARPTDTAYEWDELTVSWIAIPQPFSSWTLQGDPLCWTAPTPYPFNEGGCCGQTGYYWDEPTLSWLPRNP